jgi:retron-type reverse transcriptase
MKNKGATTQRIDKISSDAASMKLIEKIHIELKENNSKFNPLKRIFIDKIGKNPKVNTQLEKIYK